VLSTNDITTGQPTYDFIVNKTGCSNSSDTLDCLRAAPFEVLLDAMNETPGLFAYSSVNVTYLPTTDDVFLKENAQDLLAKGQFTRVSLGPKSEIHPSDFAYRSVSSTLLIDERVIVILCWYSLREWRL
jgi:hypothetical protein